MKMLLSKITYLLLIPLLVCHIEAGDLGLKLGPQRSHFDNSSFHLEHFKIGIFYSIGLGDGFSLNPEIYFSHLGSRTVNIRFDSAELAQPYPEQYKNRLSYIELPLLVKYKIPTRGDLKPMILAGGYIAFRVSRNLSLPDNIDWQHPWENREYWSQAEFLSITEENTPLPFSSDDIYRPYAGSEGGIVLGIGLEKTYKNVTFIIDWRLNLGLTNVYQSIPETRERRNNALSFMIGLGF